MWPPPPVARRRVVVTGMGMVTGLGDNVTDTWRHLLAGRSAVKSLSACPHYLPSSPEISAKRREELLQLPCQVCAPILSDRFKVTSRSSRGQALAMQACDEAMADAQLVRLSSEPTESGPSKSSSQQPRPSLSPTLCPQRIGVSLGVGMPGLHDVSDVCRELYLDEKGAHYNRISPFFVPKILGNTPAGSVAIKYGLRGPNACLTTACATGAHSIGDAARWIAFSDEADIMIAGAYEASIVPEGIAGFCRMKALSTKYNQQPELASRPFDANRCGFVMGEGAGVLVLEELSHALKRGARIYGELRGFGMSCDAYHATSPHPDGSGARQCVQSALKDGGLKPVDIGYANAHATGTPMGDELELAALTAALRPGGGNAKVPPLSISSIKGAVGHLLGAAGSVEAVVALLALVHGVAPPNVNLVDPVEHDPAKVTLLRQEGQQHGGVQWEGDAVISTSFGFGGTNAALIFARL